MLTSYWMAQGRLVVQVNTKHICNVYCGIKTENSIWRISDVALAAELKVMYVQSKVRIRWDQSRIRQGYIFAES